MEPIIITNNELDVVDKFCYLEDMNSAEESAKYYEQNKQASAYEASRLRTLLKCLRKAIKTRLN